MLLYGPLSRVARLGKDGFTGFMVTKSELIEALGSKAALAREAGCTRQAVAQWPEAVPIRSAVQIAKGGRWSLSDLRPDVFGPPEAHQDTNQAA